MTNSAVNRYDPRNIETLELLYGSGYLSMGGDDEVASIVSSAPVKGGDVLDVGCGLGGAAIALARNHAAGHVHGIDINAAVLERANVLVESAGLADRITLMQFDPGPLSFAENSFDLAFLTAVSCHIENLVPFFSEINRVLRPGGFLVGGEWFKDNDNQAYREWDDLLRDRGLNFHFSTRKAFESALCESGFEQTSITGRTEEMTALARGYLVRSETELKQPLLELMGVEGYASFLEWTRVRENGLAQRGSGYGHFRARSRI